VVRRRRGARVQRMAEPGNADEGGAAPPPAAPHQPAGG